MSEAWQKHNGVTNGFVVTDDMITCENNEGQDEKFNISVNGTMYVVKDSSFDKKRKQPCIFPWCEYTGSNIMRLLTGNCQETFIGSYKDRPVVLCKDIFNGLTWKAFKDIHQSSADTELSNKYYTYDDVLHVISQYKRIHEFKYNKVLKDFWLMFVGDAIIGNRDCHEGNWGDLS